ncbi:ABC-type transport auxiliary lipoprotein family protein [Kordiimonas aquimaris]|uniref:ABC-type transport auxiliary lipoprotein family protein n=1 Tax=Kordiimonas aquimaris TaxID=707591 RepID=UPI0021D35EBE|nr:ABC-type transport auxiliary lipoprotein family protein [Kordiimonas aquimaris]
MVGQTVKIPVSKLITSFLFCALVLLAGCGPLISFGDDGPADDVYNLSYEGGYSANVDSENIIYLEEPLMNQGLSGVDIAVALPDDQRSTLKGVRWAGNSADLVRDYLVRSLSEKSGVKLLGDGGLDVRAGCRMTVKVWSFEFAPGERSRDDTVDVAIEFSLVRYRDGHLVGQRAFNVSTAIDTNQGNSVVAGFRAGMHALSGDAANWLGPLGSNCAL